MVRLALFLIPMLIFSTPLFAEIKTSNIFFTLMCISEKSTGFNWKQGDWKYANFKESKYIIEKIEPEDIHLISGKSLPKSGFCQLNGKNDPQTLEILNTSYGCYNLRRFGEPFFNGNSKVCLEFWNGKGTNRVLEKVTCESSTNPITFAPDGWFHSATLHDYVEKSRPDNHDKDSLAIEVGKCAVISK